LNAEHVVDRIADYLEERLIPAEVELFDAHLRVCTDCQTQVQFARTLQSNALEQGVMHIRPGRVVALAAHPEAVTEIEERHLMDCRSCRAELEWVRESSVTDVADGAVGGGAPTAADAGSRSHPGRDRKLRWSRSRGWRLGLATAVAAVLALIVILPDGSMDPERAKELARLTPIPVNLTRGPVEPDSFEEDRQLGLEAYRDGRYREAAGFLQKAVEHRPADAELHLYLGSAAMLAGDSEAALVHLQQCFEHAQTDALRAEAQWQLANAQLAVGDVDAARSVLRRLLEAGGLHADESARLLERLEE
jgi:hypothetical protein